MPLSFLRTAAGGDLIIPYYHVVSDEPVPHVQGLFRYRTTKQFREDLEFLLRRYRPIHLADLRRHVREAAPLPRHSCLLTFDDGFDCAREAIAPILEHMGAPAVFFLISSCIDNCEMAVPNQAALLAGAVRRASQPVRRAIESLLDEAGLVRAELGKRLLLMGNEHRAVAGRIATLMGLSIADYLATRRPYLSREGAKDLVRRGFAVGAHSIDHPRYQGLPLAEQLRQTRESLQSIRQDIDPSCSSFAFPFTDVGITLDFYQAMSQDGGVELSFGTARMRADLVPFSFQRFSMEKDGLPAPLVLAHEYARKLARTAIGRNAIQRDRATMPRL